jgi:flagellar basal body P-ring protein FlgI
MAARKKTKIKVKDKPDLVRDSFSKAIINVDRSAYANHQIRKKNLLDKNRKIDALEKAVQTMQEEQKELMKLLQSMSKKG